MTNVVRIGRSQITRELKIGSRVRLGGLRGPEVHEVIAIEDRDYVLRLVARRRRRSATADGGNGTRQGKAQA